MAYNGLGHSLNKTKVDVTQYLNLEIPTQAQDGYDGLSSMDDQLWSNTNFQDDFNLDSDFGSFAGGHGVVAPTALEMKPSFDEFTADGDFNFYDTTNAYGTATFTDTTTPHHGLSHPQPINTNLYTGGSIVTSPTSLISPVDKPSKSQEESARAAAEEDKRRRNTAASARFRVKKKAREAALEESAKEMANKVKAFEDKISKLEMENKWLKELLINKKGDSIDVNDMWAQHLAEVNGTARKDGVGTRA